MFTFCHILLLVDVITLLFVNLSKMSLGVKMIDRLDARPETARACCEGIVPRRTHCDTADLHKPQRFATLDGPPRSFNNFETSSIYQTLCKCVKLHHKFTKCNNSFQEQIFQSSPYSWSYLISKSNSRSRRNYYKFMDFLRNFENSSYPWTLYFTPAVLEKNNLYNCLSFFFMKWLRLEQKWE